MLCLEYLKHQKDFVQQEKKRFFKCFPLPCMHAAEEEGSFQVFLSVLAQAQISGSILPPSQTAVIFEN